MQYIFNIYTYIQVHASLATDITLSFSHYFFTRFCMYGIDAVRDILNHDLWPLTVRAGAIGCQCCSQDFRRGNELQGTRTVLRHHEWYSSPMRYPLLYHNLHPLHSLSKHSDSFKTPCHKSNTPTAICRVSCLSISSVITLYVDRIWSLSNIIDMKRTENSLREFKDLRLINELNMNEYPDNLKASN